MQTINLRNCVGVPHHKKYRSNTLAVSGLVNTISQDNTRGSTFFSRLVVSASLLVFVLEVVPFSSLMINCLFWRWKPLATQFILNVRQLKRSHWVLNQDFMADVNVLTTLKFTCSSQNVGARVVIMKEDFSARFFFSFIFAKTSGKQKVLYHSE